MGSKRRKTRNNTSISSVSRSSQQFKQIPSLERSPGIQQVGVTNNKLTKKVARLLVALLIIVVIILVISATILT